MKKLISLCLALVLMCSVLAVPALAAVEPRGNGYEGFSILYNGKSYTVSLTVSYSSTHGARTKLYTEAVVRVELDPTTVQYNTTNYGYITNTGSGNTGNLTEDEHLIVTPYVPCSKGMSQVINYVYMKGFATVTSNGVKYTSSVYGTP